MRKRDLYNKCSSWFSQAYPKAETELHFSSPYELLVAVILSAQCTDRRVNMVTPALFKAFPTVQDMAGAEAAQILPYIGSISYPNSKAAHLAEMAKQVVSRFGGEIPHDMDDLQSLPGVGRKTANVMTAVAFGGQAMPVDTHVFRVSHRIGLVPDSCTTPLSVERELVKYFPEDCLSTAHHWLILHGRYVCTAKNPKCAGCGLTEVCRYYSKSFVER
ncbi:MAG: endonuclease III [Bacteroidetes bacterium]|nr:endonuclease III [Candidatus Colenecus caballi]